MKKLLKVLGGIVIVAAIFGISCQELPTDEGIRDNPYDPEYGDGVENPDTLQNHPPQEPFYPNPEHEASNIATSTTFSWQCYDQDEGDELSYTVHLGTAENNLDMVGQGIPELLFTPENLETSRTYYWKILAMDDHGGETQGDTWSFTTAEAGQQPPAAPSNPSPDDGAVNVSVDDITFSWSCSHPDDLELFYTFLTGAYPIVDSLYEVFTDTTVTSLFFSEAVLPFETTIYWKIIAKDENNRTTEGPIWSFTSEADPGGNRPPNEPSNPNPPDGARDVSLNPRLSWHCEDPDDDPLVYDIYCGTSQNPPLMVSDGSMTSIDLGDLDGETTYYWKIVAKEGGITLMKEPDNGKRNKTNPLLSAFKTKRKVTKKISNISLMDKSGNRKQILSSELDSETPGPVWSFTTLSTVQNQPPDQPDDPEPGNNDNDVATNGINFSWDCNDPDHDPIAYDFYLGMADGALDLLAQDLPSPQYHYFREGQPLFDDTRYQWKIVAKDDHGNETQGNIWQFTTADGGDNQPPRQPYNPSPADGEQDISSPEITLNWDGDDPENDPLRYDVLFGTEQGNLRNIAQDNTNSECVVDTAQPGITYYWKVIAKDDHDNETTGPIWSFTTGVGGGGDNTAVEYDGESGYGMIENVEPYGFIAQQGYWTIEAMFKLESFAQQPEVSTIFIAGRESDKIVLFVTPDDAQGTPEVPTFMVVSNNNAHTIMPGAGNEVTLGEWTHVAAVSQDGIFSLYINGELITTDTTGVGGRISIYAAPIGIGATVIGESNIINGAIDEVRIWSSALTENQIQDRYRQQLTGNENDLEALWQFNEGNGGQFGDSSPTDNGGIIQGQYEWIDADWEE